MFDSFLKHLLHQLEVCHSSLITRSFLLRSLPNWSALLPSKLSLNKRVCTSQLSEYLKLTKYCCPQESYSLVSKLLLFGIVSKVTLCKYLGAWLVVEGSCILYGVSRDPHTGQMDRCFNMSLLYYETSPTFGGLIESFNMSTNYFAMTYIYKRLRFLGSKVASQAITLFFLAFWHGYASGYYVTFFMEMMIMKMEKDVSSTFCRIDDHTNHNCCNQISTMVIKYRTRNQWLNRLLNRTSIRIIIHILMRVHVVAMFGYAFLPFGVLHYENYAPIYEQVYYVGHLLYGTWFVASCFFDF